MNKPEATQTAKGFFKSYPSINEFHLTSDGQAFESKHDAQAHAESLDKKEPVVFSIDRNEPPTSKGEKAEEAAGEEKQAKADAAAKAAEEKKAAPKKAAKGK